MMLLQLKKKKKMEYLPRIMHLKAFKGVMRSCADLIFKEKKKMLYLNYFVLASLLLKCLHLNLIFIYFCILMQLEIVLERLSYVY